MALWMVRAGKEGSQEATAIEKNVIVLGWRELGDLSGVKSKDDLAALLRRAYPDAKPNTTANYIGQIWAFVSRIQVKDWVVLPLKTRSAIAVGEVISGYEYRTDLGDLVRHTRRVKWIKSDLPRTAFEQDLLYSFGAFMTVCKIKRNDAEARVHAIVEGKPAPVPLSSQDEEIETGETKSIELLDVERVAADQIQKVIARRYKGHKLADLVDSVLRAQGYVTHVSPPGADGGVDILAGSGPMGFDAPRVCVQVKSSDAPADVGVMRELRGTMEAHQAEHGLLVCWGGFKASVLREAATAYFKMRLWDQGDLLQQIVANYDRFPESMQAELPLKRIWALALEDETE
ncbi:MAG: restriction endonuclease [Candidatus Acidiferrales bacterium]